MTIRKGFGSPLRLSGKMKTGVQSSAVPFALISQSVMYPLPITVGGSNNVTFTLKGSTRRISFWIADDLFEIDEDLAYTWIAGSNPTLNSAGVEGTTTNSTLGVWYMYAAIADDGTPSLWPSQTAPEDTANKNGFYLGHPGTSRTRDYRYVGVMWCTTAATPAFLTTTKIGLEWHFAALTASPASTLTVTSVFSVRIPKLSKYGGRVCGSLLTGKNSTLTVGPTSTSGQGVQVVTATLTSSIVGAPFEMPADDTTGELYAIAPVKASALISITRWKDVV